MNRCLPASLACLTLAALPAPSQTVGGASGVTELVSMTSGVGGNPHPSLSVVGQVVNVQFWGHDASGVGGVFLTDALEYVVGP